jgi:PadR family transcriptional regulator, regulatory protein PadR
MVYVYITYTKGTALEISSSSRPPHAPGAHRRNVPLTAWLLLLLLKNGESHGWALLGALHDRGISANPSHAYRTLRELEHEGELTSRWMESDGGPQRRSYRLSAKGRRTLAALVAQIGVGWHQEEMFLRAVQRAHGAPQPDRREQAATDLPDRPSPLSDDCAHAAHRATELAADGATARRDTPPPTPSRELLAGWLLLQLEGGASHGYDLRRALAEHDLHPDTGTMYRLLRELDRAGWVQSRWMTPAAGPRRRLYRITARGRRNRDELARLITAFRDSRTAFLHDCDGTPR